MRPERETEDLLLRVLPGLEGQWVGATLQEIEAIARLAGRPLPDFYAWFLSRMGGSMGSASFARIDFRARTVLGVRLPEGVADRYLLIGHQTDPMAYYHCYELGHPARGDARVVLLDADGELLDVTFETLREMIVSGVLLQERISTAAQQCEGWLSVKGPHVAPLLVPVMSSLGFSTPVPTGPCCGLFERPDAALVCQTRDPTSPVGVEYFSLGGPNAIELRRILASISTRSPVRVEVASWTPQLP